MSVPHEQSPSLHDLIGDADPHQIIEHQLSLAEFSGDQRTRKYLVDEHPEVVVRHGPGEPEPQSLESVEQAYSSLPQHGIPALPYLPVRHNGETYVFTELVHGVELPTLLTPNITQDLLTTVDHQWVSIANYIRTGYETGQMRATDILGNGQYMYGATALRPRQRLIMPDLGEWAVNYKDTKSSATYERMMIDLGSEIIEIEQATQRTLPLARIAAEQAIEIGAIHVDRIADNFINSRFIKAARYTLANNVILDPDEDADFIFGQLSSE